MGIKLTEKQKELVEKLGVLVEKNGTPPAQARIIALLMICDQAELTFDEIYNTIKISKSAASTAINSLLALGRLEYYTKTGDRKRYFMVPIHKTVEDFEKNISQLLQTKVMYKEILQSRSKANQKFNSHLTETIAFLNFLEVELQESYKKWKKKK